MKASQSVPALERASHLSDQAYEVLRRAIANGSLGDGGTRLVESSLCDWLQISRTPVRDAIRRLTEEGWVSQLAGGGAIVRPVTAQDIVDAYQTRAVLEGLAARLASSYIRPEDARACRSAIEIAKSSLFAGDLDEMSRSNTRFHEIIVQRSNNARLVEFVDRLDIYVVYYRRTMRERMGRSDDSRETYYQHQEDAIKRHEELLTALEELEAARAEHIMVAHIQANADAISHYVAGDGGH